MMERGRPICRVDEEKLLSIAAAARQDGKVQVPIHGDGSSAWASRLSKMGMVVELIQGSPFGLLVVRCPTPSPPTLNQS